MCFSSSSPRTATAEAMSVTRASPAKRISKIRRRTGLASARRISSRVLAFGIGTSEVEHVLASQCLLQTKPKTMEVRVDGKLGPSVTAKDIILALIAKIGTAGGTGGGAVRSFGDHRLAMALAIAGLAGRGDVSIEDAEAVTVSYPDFWRHIGEVSA